MVSIALIGAGRIGRLHAANLAADPRVHFAAVADLDTPAAEAVAATQGTSAASVEAVIADPTIEALLIASATNSHADLIEQAARAGKAILCEKPVDLDLARARQAVAVARDCGVPLAIGFNRRFDASFQALKRRLEAGEIGRLESLAIVSRDPAPPPLTFLRHSGGLFRDMMIHDFDMLRWLTGEEPVELFAMAANLIDPAIGEIGDVDTANLLLRMASGKLCQITVSRRASYGYDQRIECHGSRGMIRADNRPITTLETANAEGFRRDPIEPFFMERYAAAYRAELEHFVDCLAAGKAPSPSGEDGLAALALADKAGESLASGLPVKISPP